MNADFAPVRPAERIADGVVQGVNVVLAVAGCAALGVLACSLTDRLRAAALAAYAVGLLAMVSCSALYAWGRYGRRRELIATSTRRRSS